MCFLALYSKYKKMLVYTKIRNILTRVCVMKPALLHSNEKISESGLCEAASAKFRDFILCCELWSNVFASYSLENWHNMMWYDAFCLDWLTDLATRMWCNFSFVWITSVNHFQIWKLLIIKSDWKITIYVIMNHRN